MPCLYVLLPLPLSQTYSLLSVSFYISLVLHFTDSFHYKHLQSNSRTAMAYAYLLFSLLLLHSILLINYTVKCKNEEKSLLLELNSYRATSNLTTLTQNDKAKCLAEKIADQFKDQPCTNTTGANTVPGTEPQFSNYPELLTKCHLNVTITRDGAVLPACVPHLDPGLVLSNFTQSQYTNYLNDTKFTGIGIGSEDDWIVVVLTTNTPEGSYMDGSNLTNFVSKLGPVNHILFLLVAFSLVILNLVL